ncbi:HAD hydrolase-like protein [Clostridium sp. AN503]|uniref:HAD family hydrolase n=1 Tax=Clostridium sp. AN503 TaxID=3160598 RepID=UPI00345AEDAD
MTEIFDSFKKKKEYLVCIDSDGCAMDTMDIKHFRCFGPCMIQEWGLGPWRDAIQNRWNAINLYTMTRGINRFKGLEIALCEVDSNYRKIEGLDELVKWVESAKELSNDSLVKHMKEHEAPILLKALAWSEEVNRQVEQLPETEKVPFGGVRLAIEALHRTADVAVVSSANQQAIMEEWETQGLLRHTDVVLSQNAGSKAYCIKRLLDQGYEKNHAMMIGDAPGDRDAAAANGILFYPILVKREHESWKRILDEALDRFVSCSYEGEYQERLNREFEENLA